MYMCLMRILPIFIKICEQKSKVLTLIVRGVTLKYVIHLQQRWKSLTVPKM